MAGAGNVTPDKVAPSEPTIIRSTIDASWVSISSTNDGQHRQSLGCDHEQDRGQVQRPESTGKRYIHQTEHNIISQDAHQGKDDGVR